MIIPSILDNDQYKFTMQQGILKLGYAATPVVYKFKCRNKGINLAQYFGSISYYIKELEALKLSRDELDYLWSIRYFSKEYLEFLKYFKFDPDLVECKLENGDLSIIVRGPWFSTILFEVPILAIVSQIYTTNQPGYNNIKAIDNLNNKLKLLMPYPRLSIREFGTRRRSSYNDQSFLISRLKDTPNFNGTSNLHFAMKYNTPSFGTMAHEWLQAHQQLGYRLDNSQKMAFENWIKVYRGDLGIALADVINTDAFLKDFDDPFLYKLFDGVREDSEPDPIDFGHQIIDFYLSRGINPASKTIVFSNSLDFKKAINLYLTFADSINTTFGIGTYLSNDAGVKPLNIVLKMIYCNNQPVAKISNSPGKGMCEVPEFVNYLKSVYGVKNDQTSDN